MERKPSISWGLMLVVVSLLAAHPDTHRGICEEGGLPRGGANEQVFSLQLVRQKNESISVLVALIVGGKMIQLYFLTLR